jgi:hypothetical protein
MNRLLISGGVKLVILMLLCSSAWTQTIQQKLLVLQNSGTLGGPFNIAVQVKGTSLPVANTLGSATIDVQFDNTKLSFISSTNWAFGSADGYNRSANNNTTFIRVAITGGGVNENGGGTPPGFDIGSVYATWVQLNFTILVPSGTTSLTIAPGSNAIGLFANHANEPNTGVITNQVLTPPENIINEPLPVQLSRFIATVVNQRHVRLDWTTISEINNYGFYVERKRQGDSAFTEIANSFTPGHGTTNEPHHYTFTDESPGAPTVWYRLRQVDLDGTRHYTEPIMATGILVGVEEKEPAPIEFSLKQNYPNPFNPTTEIKFSVETIGRTTLEVFNVVGQRVATLFDDVAEPGRYYMVRFHASNLASGVYLYRLQSGKKSELKKLLLLK